MELLFYIVIALWVLGLIGFALIYRAHRTDEPWIGCSCIACSCGRSKYDDTY